jgi:hypothetical protein
MKARLVVESRRRRFEPRHRAGEAPAIDRFAAGPEPSPAVTTAAAIRCA